MATTTRLLRTSVSLHPPSSSSSSSSSPLRTVRFVNGDSERKNRSVSTVKAAVAASENLATTSSTTRVEPGMFDLLSVMTNVSHATLVLLRTAVRRKPSKLYTQMLIEKAIIDCRFFTLFAVAGTLVGSILCFVEGCFFVVESYIQYFNTLSKRSDQGYVVQLLIEAIDMFLVGTALLIFGMGLYTMFVGLKRIKGKEHWLSSSNFLGLFYMKTVPTWVDMQSVTQAKSRIGHAVMLILQVGVLEKFKTVPLVSGLDLACFAGALLLSSASIFILSKLSVQ